MSIRYGTDYVYHVLVKKDGKTEEAAYWKYGSTNYHVFYEEGPTLEIPSYFSGGDYKKEKIYARMGMPVYSHLYGNSDSSLPSSETAFSDDNVENWVGAAFINLDFKPDFTPYDMAFWIALSSSKVDDWVIAGGVRKGKKISGRKCRTFK